MRRIGLIFVVLSMLICLAMVGAWRGGLFDPGHRAKPPATAGNDIGIRGLFVEPEDGRQPVIAELAAASSSIDLLIYLLTDQVVIDELVAAEQRGVTVRVILEQYPFGGSGNPEEVAQALTDAGADVRWASHDFSFSHVKTFIVDRDVAVVMNLNLSRSSFEQNREFGIVTTAPDDVASAQAIFDADWEGISISDPGTLVVSPLNSRIEFARLIDGANESLDIYAEVIRDDEIVDRLIAAVNRGIAVRLVMSPDSDPVNQQMLLKLESEGIEIRLLSEPYIHAKAILMDGDTAFIGSQNFTETSLDENREIGIVVQESEIVTRLRSIFESDFTAGGSVSDLLAMKPTPSYHLFVQLIGMTRYSAGVPLDKRGMYVYSVRTGPEEPKLLRQTTGTEKNWAALRGSAPGNSVSGRIAG